MKKKKYIQILDQTEQIERILTKGDVNKCLDNAIMRCKALILSAKPPVITEVYLLQDLLETKALLNATKPLNHKEYMKGGE